MYITYHIILAIDQNFTFELESVSSLKVKGHLEMIFTVYLAKAMWAFLLLPSL